MEKESFSCHFLMGKPSHPMEWSVVIYNLGHTEPGCAKVGNKVIEERKNGKSEEFWTKDI